MEDIFRWNRAGDCRWVCVAIRSGIHFSSDDVSTHFSIRMNLQKIIDCLYAQAFPLFVIQVPLPGSTSPDEYLVSQHQCVLRSHDSHNQCVSLRSLLSIQLWGESHLTILFIFAPKTNEECVLCAFPRSYMYHLGNKPSFLTQMLLYCVALLLNICGFLWTTFFSQFFAERKVYKTFGYFA